MRLPNHLLLWAIILCPCAAPAQDQQNLPPLFNGKDLSGWIPVNVAPKTFVVKDNMIVCDGKPTGVMRTEKMYENFVLELEYMHLVPGGNAGLFVWSDAVTSPGVPFTRSIEVQILDGSESESHTSHGDIFSIHGATMKPDRPHPRGAMRCLPSERRANPAGQWNHYRVECNDGVLKLAVNGKVVSGGSKCSPRKGYICLESEGGVVHYRNIRLQEMPGTNPKPEEVAKADEGFKSIYTGVDLAGWREDEKQKGHWQPKDWILFYDGKAGATDNSLWTEKSYGDFELIADWRVPKDADPATPATLQLRGPSGTAVDLREPREAGRWNRVVVTMKGSQRTVLLNGKPLPGQDQSGPSGDRGPIGLRATGPMEFANLYVKELK